MNLALWRNLSDAEIAAGDIATFNLRVAVGLPGAEGLNIAACLETLDHWTALIRQKTERSLRRHATEYSDLTENQFRILVMVTVLQRDLGVTYDLAFVEGEYDGSDSRHLFLHGTLTGHGGTCVTLPLLYVAIGRRLGYPLRLARAREHYYCRWSDANPFCIEATSPGFEPHDDEHFRHVPRPLGVEKPLGYYLRDLSPREELSETVMSLSICLQENLLLEESMKAHWLAAQISPDDPMIGGHWAIATMMYLIMKQARERHMPILIDPEICLDAAIGLCRDSLNPDATRYAKERLLRIIRNRQRRAGITQFQSLKRPPVKQKEHSR